MGSLLKTLFGSANAPPDWTNLFGGSNAPLQGPMPPPPLISTLQRSAQLQRAHLQAQQNALRGAALGQGISGTTTSGSSGVGAATPSTAQTSGLANMPTPHSGSPCTFDGAMIVMNVEGKPRFMSYTGYYVLVHDGTIRVLEKTSGSTVSVIPLSSTFGVYKSTSELIKAWVIRNEEPNVDGPDGCVQGGGAPPVRDV